MIELATTARAGAALAWRAARGSGAWCGWLAVLWVAWGAAGLLACGEPAADSSSALRAQAEPHLREFEAFDAWARRNFDADLALRDARALEETVFAPIRRERHVVAAWVEREGADPRQVGLRTESALRFDWVELRGVPMLTRLEVVEAQLRDPRVPRAEPQRVLVLSRRVPSARGGGEVRVTVAYALNDSPAD